MHSARWQAMAAEVAGLVDGLGVPVDDGIRDTVIALRLLGIETVFSCEGHLDYGFPCPWVDVAARDAPALRRLTRGFYRERDAVPWGQRLVLIPGAWDPEAHAWADYRILCRTPWQYWRRHGHSLPYARRTAPRLAAYQEEMHAFTAYLIRQCEEP